MEILRCILKFRKKVKLKIGNKWYNVDATWDDDDPSNIMGIDFFLVSDAKTKENNTAHEL